MSLILRGNIEPPRRVGGGLAWLDAPDTQSIVQSGNLVSSWRDKFGRGNNATQASGGLQPTTNVTKINGLNVLDFDAKALSLPSSAFRLTNGDNTIFVVARGTGSSGSDRRIISAVESGSGRLRVGYSYSGNIGFYSSNTTASGRVEIAMTVTNTHIVTCFKNGTTQSISVNNGAAITNSLGANESGITALTIGAIDTGLGQSFLGSVGEIIIYERALSASEIIMINTYLANKWGIAIS